jgi:hypothetical protein
MAAQWSSSRPPISIACWTPPKCIADRERTDGGGLEERAFRQHRSWASTTRRCSNGDERQESRTRREAGYDLDQ